MGDDEVEFSFGNRPCEWWRGRSHGLAIIALEAPIPGGEKRGARKVTRRKEAQCPASRKRSEPGGRLS